MNYSFLQRKFNNLIATNNVKNDEKVSVNFIFDDILRCSSIIKESRPYSKVAIIYDSSSVALGVKIGNALKVDGFSPYHCIVEEEFSVERLGILFALPEDVRYIVAVGNGGVRHAQYLSSVKNLPLTVIPTSLHWNGILNAVLRLKNGEKTDEIFAFVQLTVLVDLSILRANDEQLGYSVVDIACSPINLIDYQIYCSFMDEEFNSDTRNILLNTLLSFGSISDKPTTAEVFVHSLAIKYADFVCENKLSYCSSVNCYENVCKERGIGCSNIQRLAFAEKVLNLYYLCFANDLSTFSLADYNERVDYISKNRTEVIKNLEWLIKSSKIYRERSSQQEEFIKNIYEKTSTARQIFAYLKQKIGEYLYQKGKNTPLSIDALRHSGDLSFNGLTILRERGFLEK